MPTPMFLITYTWQIKGQTNWHYAYDVYRGFIPDWVLEHNPNDGDKNEEYFIVNSIEINDHTYNRLKGEVD